MSHKFVGPVGKQFRGDKQRAMMLMGSARLLAQQALDRIEAMGGRGVQVSRRTLGDGSTVEAWVSQQFGQSPQVRVKIWCPDGKEEPEAILLESGALYWNVALLNQQYPLLIAAKGALKQHFLGEPPYIQGPLTVEFDEKGNPLRFRYAAKAPELTDDTYPSAIYTSAEKHALILGELGRVQPVYLSTLYSGWARLWIQALAGSEMPLADVLGDVGLTYDTGLLISPVDEFWLGRISESGMSFTKLALAPVGAMVLRSIKKAYPEMVLAEAPWHSDQQLRLKLCYVLMHLLVPKSEERAVVSFTDTKIAAAYADGFNNICSHGWQWNRKSNQAVLITGKWADEDNNAYISRKCTVTIDWSGEGNPPLPSLKTTTSSPWRINPSAQLLWLPDGTFGAEQKLRLMLPKPNYLYPSFEPYAGAVGYIHAYYDVSDTLQEVTYLQFTGTSTQNVMEDDFGCFEPGGSRIQRYASSLSQGTGGFDEAELCEDIRGGVYDYEWEAITDHENSLTYHAHLGSGTDATFFTYFLNIGNNDPCYGNQEAYAELSDYHTSTGNTNTDFCASVTGYGLEARRTLNTTPSEVTTITTALVVSAYDPTVVCKLKSHDYYRAAYLETVWQRYVSQNYSTQIIFNTGADMSDPCSGGTPVVFASNVIGDGPGWSIVNQSEELSSTTYPEASTHEFIGYCKAAGTNYPVQDEFPLLFEYDLLDPETGQLDTNYIFGFASAGGVATYEDGAGGANSEDYPEVYAHYSAQAIWLGGA